MPDVLGGVAVVVTLVIVLALVLAPLFLGTMTDREKRDAGVVPHDRS